MVQSLRFAWGEWEDEWRGGKFTCVFRQAAPKDGWIEAKGLYEAQDGDTIDDLYAVDEEIANRTAVVAKDGLLRVPEDFVDLLAMLPSLLSELTAHIRERDTEGSISAFPESLQSINSGLTQTLPPVNSLPVSP